jgi:hypothetical protein
MEVKVQTGRAIRAGPRGLTSTPDTEKTIPGIIVKTFSILVHCPPLVK